MDIIFFRGIKAFTLIGVYDWEREAPQEIELNLDIALPAQTAAFSDNIEDTIHYGELVGKLHDYLSQQQFLLIEALAEGVAQFILMSFNTKWVKVSLSKPGILPDVQKVGIVIERLRR